MAIAEMDTWIPIGIIAAIERQQRGKNANMMIVNISFKRLKIVRKEDSHTHRLTYQIIPYVVAAAGGGGGTVCFYSSRFQNPWKYAHRT